MKKLIVKFILFCILLSTVYLFALWQVAQGQVDFFYTKFTYQARSLILGISRANHGISPSVIEQNFGKNEIEYPILNFAFVLDYSKYGPIYLNAVQKKLHPETKNGLFILEVDPASLSIFKSQKDTITTIKGNDAYLSEIKHFNRNPNLEYIRKMYYASLYMGFDRSRIIDTLKYIHPDGWVEFRKKGEHYEVTPENILEWERLTLEEANDLKGYTKPSKIRVKYLEKTISYLNDFGKVYLIRAPVSQEFLEIEQVIWPDFNDQIKEIARSHGVAYFDYSEDAGQYELYDGSHLFGHSAKDFTQKICDDIKALDQNLND